MQGRTAHGTQSGGAGRGQGPWLGLPRAGGYSPRPPVTGCSVLLVGGTAGSLQGGGCPWPPEAPAGRLTSWPDSFRLGCLCFLSTRFHPLHTRAAHAPGGGVLVVPALGLPVLCEGDATCLSCPLSWPSSPGSALLQSSPRAPQTPPGDTLQVLQFLGPLALSGTPPRPLVSPSHRAGTFEAGPKPQTRHSSRHQIPSASGTARVLGRRQEQNG